MVFVGIERRSLRLALRVIEIKMRDIVACACEYPLASSDGHRALSLAVMMIASSMIGPHPVRAFIGAICAVNVLLVGGADWRCLSGYAGGVRTDHTEVIISCPSSIKPSIPFLLRFLPGMICGFSFLCL